MWRGHCGITVVAQPELRGHAGPQAPGTFDGAFLVSGSGSVCTASDQVVTYIILFNFVNFHLVHVSCACMAYHSGVLRGLKLLFCVC